MQQIIWHKYIHVWKMKTTRIEKIGEKYMASTEL